ncbi:MAG TPA: type II toxin-antitoxin system prevent-host-death family antitoxin [Blastocatellia bacterium]|nr:type II toxin-antitoxin system prevent-host-death family antitoxin [Blastocatellia bacterium]
MKSVNIAELKNQLSRYLKEVKAGGEILVRDRDAPIARIVPLTHGSHLDDELLALAAKGKVHLGAGAIEDSFWSTPAPRISPTIMRRVVKEERDEN